MSTWVDVENPNIARIEHVARERQRLFQKLYDDVRPQLLELFGTPLDDPRRREDVFLEIGRRTGQSAADVQSVMWMLHSAGAIRASGPHGDYVVVPEEEPDDAS
ncbi:MAG: hypothetical protein HOV68_13740 [Streptomycetaceae bacterium]|nr:hypothetical protein [Streptomycetaceae bacterium]